MTKPQQTESRPTLRPTGYLVRSDGAILSKRTGKPMKVAPRDNGYFVIEFNLSSGRVVRTVHSVVCEAWHGPRPPGYQASHLNGDQTDNRPSNLAWETPQANVARRDYSRISGERHGQAALTDDQVIAIRAALAVGARQVDLAAEYGVSHQTISGIKHNRQHKIDPQTYTQKATTQALRTFGHDLRSIREGFAGGHLTADVAAAEFRAACVEAGRKLERLAAAA